MSLETNKLYGCSHEGSSVTVVGKVFRPNKKKVLALNGFLEEYFKLVDWYLSSIRHQRLFCTEMAMPAKQLFNLNTALIQTARDKAVEIVKSFNEKKREARLRLRDQS